MKTMPTRIDGDLFEAAKVAGEAQSRSAAQQLDHWADWLKHTLWYSQGDRLEYKPVRMQPLTVDSVPPKVRTF